jgi:hypothetical protein
MVEFFVSARDFKKGIRFILVGRKDYMDQDTADFRAVADDLELCSTGTSTHMNAQVIRAGNARVPLPVLRNIKKIAVSFTKDRLRVQIEAGRIKVESFSFSHPDVELKRIGTRMADLPVNAPVLDALAMQKLYSAEELAESGLAGRVLEAQERASSAIESAARSLQEFSVPREAVAELLDAHISLHAKVLKALMAVQDGN